MRIGCSYNIWNGIGILQLSGYLGQTTTRRFHGAVDWAQFRAPGPIVLDLGELAGWSLAGEAAVLDAANRLTTGDRQLVICGLHDLPAPTLANANTSTGAPIAIYLDLAAALAALAPATPRRLRHPSLEPLVCDPLEMLVTWDPTAELDHALTRAVSYLRAAQAAGDYAVAQRLARWIDRRLDQRLAFRSDPAPPQATQRRSESDSPVRQQQPAT